MAYRGLNGISEGSNLNTLKLEISDLKVDLPDNSYVRDADMTREGVDLVLESPSGTIVIEGYFTAEPAPNLVAPDGTMLTPDLVHSFAHSNGQYAQAGTMNDESPVGAVQEFSGEATVTRADGSVEVISIGTPIFQGDVIETDANGAVNITFIDETSFAVSEDARLAIDEFVFDPSTSSGSQNFSVLKGVFVFTSGLIGREDPDDVEIETPIGSIGIRGTIIAGDVTAGEITVVEGAIVLKDFSGNEMTLANQFETARFNTLSGTIDNMGELSANDVGTKFSSVSGVSPSLFSSINDAAAEAQGGQDAQGTGAEDTTAEPAAQDGDQTSDSAPAQQQSTTTEFGGADFGGGDNSLSGGGAAGTGTSGAGNAAASGSNNATGNTPPANGAGQTAPTNSIDTQQPPPSQTGTGGANTAPVGANSTIDATNITTGVTRGFVSNGNTLSYDASANFSDVDGDVLSYTLSGVEIDGGALTGAPAWITLDAAGNLTVSIPDTAVSGTNYKIVVTADDGNGNTSTSTITLDADFADILGTATTDAGLATTAASDLLIAFAGDDTININHDDARIYADAGNDVINVTANNGQILAGPGDDTININGFTNGNTIDGGSETNTVDFSGNAGAITLKINVDGNGFSTFDGTNTNTFINIQHVTDSTNNNTIDLSYANNWSDINLDSGELSIGGSLSLNVDDGFDTVIGTTYNDTIHTSLDLNNFDYNGDAGNDTFTMSGTLMNNFTYDGGAGIDTLDMSGTTVAISLDMDTGLLDFNGSTSNTVTNVENVLGGSAADQIYGNALDNHIEGGDGNDIIQGLGGNDTLYGNDGDDSIEGGDGDDYIFGGMGNDTIDGGSGFNTIDGGDGNDTFLIDMGTGGDITGIIAGTGTYNGGNNDTVGGSNFGDVIDFSSTGSITLDLRSNSNMFSDIETINLSNTGGPSVITLDFDSVFQMTDANNTLIIDDVGGSIINFDTNGTSSQTGSDVVAIGGENYNEYTITQSGVNITLLIDQTVNSVGIADIA